MKILRVTQKKVTLKQQKLYQKGTQLMHLGKLPYLKELTILIELFHQHVRSIIKIPVISHYIIHVKYFIWMILVNRK